MLSTLTQIITTFLSIGATFLLAYIVYLYSTIANIDLNIRTEGQEIVSLLRSAPTYKSIFTSLEVPPIQRYQTIYPDKNSLEIYQAIANDLASAAVFNNVESKNRLLAGKASKTHVHMIGNTFFWFVEESVDHLVAAGVYWPGRKHGTSSNLPPDTSQAELFPIGNIAVEQWVTESKTILNYLQFLFKAKDLFITDLEQYIEKSDVANKRIYKKYDHKKWISDMEEIVSKLEIHTSRISSLLQMKKMYSVNERLPHLKSIILLWVGTLILGIILPLALLAFSYEPGPTDVSLVIGAFAFIFLIGGVWLIEEDIISSPERANYIKYLDPFKKQLTDYKSNDKLLVFNLALTNEIIQLIDNKELKQPAEFAKNLKDYRDTVKASNVCSEKIAVKLSNEINQSVVLKSFVAKPVSGDQVVFIFKALWPEGRKDLLDRLSKFSMNFVIIGKESMGRDVYFKIKTPQTHQEVDELKQEICRIYDRYSASEEGKSCMTQRKNLEPLRDMLIKKIN